MTGQLACHEIHKWYGPKAHSASLAKQRSCSQALYNQLMPLQSMAQLYADHKAMAEVLHNDNATIQQLKDAGIHHFTYICLTCNHTLLLLQRSTFAPCTTCVSLIYQCPIHVHILTAEFDLVLRDACYWPAALLQDTLGIDSVELWPVVILMPWLWESEFSLPNPVAYLPQVGMDFTPNMVSCFLRKILFALHTNRASSPCVSVSCSSLCCVARNYCFIR